MGSRNEDILLDHCNNPFHCNEYYHHRKSHLMLYHKCLQFHYKYGKANMDFQCLSDCPCHHSSLLHRNTLDCPSVLLCCSSSWLFHCIVCCRAALPSSFSLKSRTHHRCIDPECRTVHHSNLH